MKNKQGLSTIVTTLIIILLVLVAIGIIWSVVKGLLDKGRQDIENSEKCRDIDITITKLSSTTAANNTTVTLKRSPTGMDEGVGVKMNFLTETASSGLIYFQDGDKKSIMLVPFNQSTSGPLGLDATPISGQSITKVEVVPFFLDDAGAEVLCQSQTTREF